MHPDVSLLRLPSTDTTAKTNFYNSGLQWMMYSVFCVCGIDCEQMFVCRNLL